MKDRTTINIQRFGGARMDVDYTPVHNRTELYSWKIKLMPSNICFIFTIRYHVIPHKKSILLFFNRNTLQIYIYIYIYIRSL